MAGLTQQMIVFPEHPLQVTAAQARALAAKLADLADEADGGDCAFGFVRRDAVLRELAALRERVALLCLQRQDY